MEKMIALLLIVYAISFLVGENLRDYLYAKPREDSSSSSATGTIPGKANLRPGKKWRRYSGLNYLDSLRRIRWNSFLSSYAKSGIYHAGSGSS